MTTAASPVEDPLDKHHREIDSRILKTLEAVRSLRSGGTAMDVREALLEITNQQVAHLRTIRRDLWLLEQLEKIEFELSGDGVRYWRAK